jgi:hypothetical protein
VKSSHPIPQLQHQATLKAVLNSNKMITAIHENFDNRTIAISTAEPHVHDSMEWLSQVLPMFPYRPFTVDDIRNPGPKGSRSVATGKYSKVFAAATDTDSTSDSTFDPSTIASSRPSRQNAWTKGPPINVTFDRRPSSRTVSVNPTTHSHTYYGFQEHNQTTVQ